MACLETLPFLDGTKVIIIEEGSDAIYGRKLLSGWLKMQEQRNEENSFALLTLLDAKYWYENESGLLALPNVKLHDFSTLSINSMVEDNNCNDLWQFLNNVKPKLTIILDCLSSLIIYVGLAKALWFLDKLSKQAKQLICIYRRDIIQSRPPRIDAFGTTYVRLAKYHGPIDKANFTYITDIIHRKIGGSIFRQTELVKQDSITCKIKSTKIEQRKDRSGQVHQIQAKIQSSFRIEMNTVEMKQRQETILPYTMNKDMLNTSKIFYQPDDIDDVDEEDPDDDLCI